jgi:hypothetical protein
MGNQKMLCQPLSTSGIQLKKSGLLLYQPIVCSMLGLSKNI